MVQKVVMGTRLPAKLWLDDVEDSCMAQIISLASLPFAFKHIAIMPDAHTGKGFRTFCQSNQSHHEAYP